VAESWDGCVLLVIGERALRALSGRGGDTADDDVETWTLGSGARFAGDLSVGERDRLSNRCEKPSVLPGCSLSASDALSSFMGQLELGGVREVSS